MDVVKENMQFGLLPKLLWLLMMYEVLLNHA